MTKEEIQKKREEFNKDLEARRNYHKKMNFHYLMYKGISLLNKTYSREVLESLGLQIHVPRTFMTIESIRPDLDRPIDITCRWRNRTERKGAEKTQQMLKGEWARSKADTQKAKSEFDALIYGSGYLLNFFDIDEYEEEVFDSFDEEGRPVYIKGINKQYEGMKVGWLDPFYVIPDRRAKTYEPGTHTSPQRIWVPSIWDFDSFKAHAKRKDYKNIDEIQKGGFLEELDSIRKTIDALYVQEMGRYKTRDSNGALITQQPENVDRTSIDENAIGIITEYTPTHIHIYAGENWTLVHSAPHQMPKREIPIYAVKDYDVPGELEGIGEAEVLRWQQYEENKIHNLMYLQVILNTVKRYGIVEELLQDPTEARSTNPLKWIRMKYMPGVSINDAIQELNQTSSSEVPLGVLGEVKTIGQMATGQAEYSVGGSEGDAGTLGEAEMMNTAGNKRIRQKIQQMEERAITPILESWQSAIPRLYTDELDFLINDGTNNDVKFLPFDRKMNTNAKLVAEYSVREGATSATTLEEVFESVGYSDVVFVSDLVGKYDIIIKTSLAFMDKENMIRQYQGAIAIAMAENERKIAVGQPPEWDTSKLTEELLRQFDDIIEDVEEYRLEQPQQQLPQQPQGQPPTPGQPAQPMPEQPNIETAIPTANLPISNQ